jgi:hypothetical protein
MNDTFILVAMIPAQRASMPSGWCIRSNRQHVLSEKMR